MEPLGPGSRPPAPPDTPPGPRPRWLVPAVAAGVAAAVALVAVVGLLALPGRPAPRPAAARAAKAARAAASPAVRLVPLPPPRPDLTPAQLGHLLSTVPVLPKGFTPLAGGVGTLTGYGQDPPPATLACPDIVYYLDDPEQYDNNYAADANVAAMNPAGDELYVDLYEAVSPATAQRDLAALRACGTGCRPALALGIEGQFSLTVTTIPGLGADNVDLHMTQHGPGVTGTGPFGARDILLIRDGSYLLDISTALQSPPGTAHNPGQARSVSVPSLKIAESLLTEL